MSQQVLEWSIFHPIKKEWIDLGVKGSVQEALIELGELPNPFYGTNEEKFGWIENYQWRFKSIFFISEQELSNEFIEVNFPSLDTYAEIFINDLSIKKTENAFIPHLIDLTPFVKEGMNELEIVFTPPIIKHKETKKEVGYQLPAPNDVHEIAVAPYVRKPQYQFGWDWALRMNTIGLNKPAEILFYNKTRILSKSVQIKELSDEKAKVEVTFEMSRGFDGALVCQSKEFGETVIEFKNGIGKRTVVIENPSLWWPNGQGEQYLYHYHFDLIDSLGMSWSVPIQFGVKTSELVQEKDEWGTSYYFKINGRRIFAKGANYIPQEIFPAKVTDSAIISMVNTMAESNFNMVRVWGGGYYPDEIFYKRCDELGIMVWQDLMFACAMYPGDSIFLENITEEFNYQIPRISSHPSVVLFNGNNEVEVAWGNWGFQIKYGLYGQSAKTIEKAYDDIFKNIAPTVISSHTNTPYVHTSPLSNWGKSELYNHGSQHYWGVWHGKDPIEDFGKKIGRFNAEYGFQSFPEFNTLLSFSDTSDWDLKSEVMKHHQKSYVGNDMILKHAKRLYGEPVNFEEFVYFSQLTQALAVSMAVVGHRLDAPRCGGTLYWQLNDCWPSPTWSSIDYFGNWKALQYQMRNDFQGVSVLEQFDDLVNRSFHFITDVPEERNYSIFASVYSFNGELIREKEFDIVAPGVASRELDLDDIIDLEKTNALVVFKYKDNEGKLSSRQFERIVEPIEKASGEGVEMELISLNDSTSSATLKIFTPVALRKCWISSSKHGVRFKKNFNTLLPGNHYIEIQFEEIPLVSDFKLMWL